jgi:recombination protein RecA
VSTGSLGLDIALGVGRPAAGPRHRDLRAESSGKTTLALHTVAEAQKKGGVCAFVDAEHALDPVYARKLGVKLDDLLISQPIRASRRSRSATRWCDPARSTFSWSTRSQR